MAATCLSSLLSSKRIIRVFDALSLATFVGVYLIHISTLVCVVLLRGGPALSCIVYVHFRQKRSTTGVALSATASRWRASP